jgi:hypothetical protein
MPDPTGTRSARLHDKIHILHLAMQFPCLPEPSTSPYLVSFRYTDETDAEMAAESVRTAEGILSRQLGVTFEGRYPQPIGSAAHYQRAARLASGMYVYIVARAEIGPLLDAREDADAKVSVAA